MCFFCERTTEIVDGENHDYTQIKLVDNQLVIETSIENSHFDCYNDCFGYDIRESNFMILYCPMCGRNLKGES
jgi:hypothetical protein